MPDTTRRTPTGTGLRVSGVCSIDGHEHCQPGPIITRDGVVALVIRCDCTCHRAVTR